MAVDSNNVLIGAATVSIDATDVGYTKGGTTVRYEPEFVDVFADQAIGVVKKARASERMYVVTTMLEVTLSRMREAFNQPASNLISGNSTLLLGYNDACVINEHAITLVGVGPGCEPRQFELFRCVAIGTREYTMSREEETAFEVEFECLKNANGIFGYVYENPS